MNSHVRLGVSPTLGTAILHSQLWASVSCSVSPARLVCCLTAASPGLHGSAASPQFLSVCSLTGLVVLADYFFNSLVVRVPCSLIFWHFWLFIDFRLVVILLLVVQGSEGFLPTPPSWLELWTFSNTKQFKRLTGNNQFWKHENRSSDYVMVTDIWAVVVLTGCRSVSELVLQGCVSLENTRRRDECH